MSRRALLIALVLAVPNSLAAQGMTFDTSFAPGANYNKAAFRFWYPGGAEKIRSIVVLVPGSNGDGRGDVADTTWQRFAQEHHAALIGVQLTDKPHDQGFIEEYVNVSRGSGDAFLHALDLFASMSRHAEVSSAPLLLWGMSAGGEFNYEFAVWHPERVAAFIVNKGNIYYTALTPRATRNVPAILFVGGKDLAFRIETVTGLFAVNRRGAALWALANEPGAGHIVGRSRDLAVVFFDDVLRLRLPESTDTLLPIAPGSGFLGDPSDDSYRPASGPAPQTPTAWLPTERVAKAWRAMMTDQPFTP
ncbi:MAG TPA: hypothetical protein VGM20_02995 [Gemmatimonadales bacterium]|jgi:poly(3-hydroxybutyrate) depolymerase